jgi:hypothetical protein
MLKQILLIICVFSISDSGRSFAKEVELNGQRFTLPDGFEIQLVAGSDMVERPVSADFDEQGRLYVTDSGGSNESL